VRNISCALTPQQIRNRTKTVTRRLGWKHAKPGELLCICEKCMGRKPGEPLVRLAIVRVIHVRREPLNLMSLAELYGDIEAIHEGFPDLSGYEFVKMFQQHMGCRDSDEVTRIEFRYLPGGKFQQRKDG